MPGFVAITLEVQQFRGKISTDIRGIQSPVRPTISGDVIGPLESPVSSEHPSRVKTKVGLSTTFSSSFLQETRLNVEPTNLK